MQGWHITCNVICLPGSAGYGKGAGFGGEGVSNSQINLLAYRVHQCLSAASIGSASLVVDSSHVLCNYTHLFLFLIALVKQLPSENTKAPVLASVRQTNDVTNDGVSCASCMTIVLKYWIQSMFCTAAPLN